MQKNKVLRMDFLEMGDQIPDRSVDLILCDPVWWELYQYEGIAKVGKRILKPGGLCIAQVGTLYKFSAMLEMAKHLDWYWEVSETLTLGASFFARRMTQLHHPHIMFANGAVNMPKRKFLPDRMHCERTKSKHQWQDGEGVYHQMVDILTKPGDTVVDFFACTGTVPVVCKRLGREFWACDTDGEMVKFANHRLAETMVNIIQPVYVQTDIYQMAGEMVA